MREACEIARHYIRSPTSPARDVGAAVGRRRELATAARLAEIFDLGIADRGRGGR